MLFQERLSRLALSALGTALTLTHGHQQSSSLTHVASLATRQGRGPLRSPGLLSAIFLPEAE